MMKQKNLKHGLQKTGTYPLSTSKKGLTTKKGLNSCQRGSLKTERCLSSLSQTTGTTHLKVGAKKGSMRLLGDKEEAKVQDVFNKLNFNTVETANSGATNYDGDLLIYTSRTDYIRSEIKYRNSDGFTVVKKHWEDIKKKALFHGGTPALITINKSKEQLITMNTRDLALLLTSANSA